METTSNAKTILVMVTGFLILAFFFRGNEIVSKVLFFTAIGIGLAEIISPSLGNHIVWFWNKFAHVLGWINTRIVLTIVFYLILFPIAFLYKLTSKDPLQRKKQEGTIFKERNHLYVKQDLENIW